MIANVICPDCDEESAFDWGSETTFVCTSCGSEWEYSVDEGSDGSIDIALEARVTPTEDKQ